MALPVWAHLVGMLEQCQKPGFMVSDLCRQETIDLGRGTVGCLSESYKDSQSKLRWRCAEGLQWLASLSSMKNARGWCPTCAHTAQSLGVSSAHQAAAAHGGKCLSETYKNNYTHLLWRCAKGHEWRALLRSVRNKGYWCPWCASGRREREVRTVCAAC